MCWILCRKEPKQAKAPAQSGAKKPAEAAAWSAPAAQPPASQDRQQQEGVQVPEGIDSALRERTAMEEVTDMAYEAAGHTQNFAEEIEDQVSLAEYTLCMFVDTPVLLYSQAPWRYSDRSAWILKCAACMLEQIALVGLESRLLPSNQSWLLHAGRDVLLLYWGMVIKPHAES